MNEIAKKSWHPGFMTWLIVGGLLLVNASVFLGGGGDPLAMQHDAIVSANRAFASRHRSKIRHFAHANGIFDRLGGEYGTFHYSYDMILANLKRLAAEAVK
jgi:hypothetical protein